MTPRLHHEGNKPMLDSNRIAQQYGVRETNPIDTSEATHETVDYSVHATIDDPNVVRFLRVRLLTDPGYPFYDVSYIYVQMKDGTHARLSGDYPSQLNKRTWKSDLIAWCKANGRYGKGMGLFDVISILS